MIDSFDLIFDPMLELLESGDIFLYFIRKKFSLQNHYKQSSQSLFSTLNLRKELLAEIIG